METKRHFSAYFVRRPLEIGACGEHEMLWEANLPEARAILERGRFPDLLTFTKLIGMVAEQDYLSEEVAEAYWLGNDKKVAVDVLCDEYLKHGKNELVVEEIRKKYKGKEIPLTHLAQIILVSDDDMNAINGCMIAEANILEVTEGGVKIERDYIVLQSGKYLIKKVPQLIKANREITPELKIGDKVAIHQGQIAMKLTDEQAERLRTNNELVVAMI